MKSTKKVQEERTQHLNDKGVRDGDYVLYWMQSSQRAEHNHALEYAVQQANDLGQRLPSDHPRPTSVPIHAETPRTV